MGTTTSAREPVLKLDRKIGSADTDAMNLLIVCIGADATGKMELDPNLVAKADLLVADCKKQTKERGEFEEALARGLISEDQIVELGEISGRADLQVVAGPRFSIFDTSGVAVQDCVISEMVMKA